MKTLSSDKKIAALAYDSALLSLALILSFVESVIPLSLPLPGFKAGLANIVITAVFFTTSAREAAAVSAARVIIVFLLFGNPISLFLSFSGASFSLASLFILSRSGISKKLSYIGVSLISALSHNTGQLIASALIVGRSVFSYTPALVTAALLYGALSGLVLNILPKKILK